MDHETSKEMFPGHGRQQDTGGESAGEPMSLQSSQDESLDSPQSYDGFEDLAYENPGAAGEY